jgi:D-hydroxyproline dehydrogenase subunit beta
METSFDVVIAGAGILGLAHAYHLAKSGRKVLVCERHLHAHGASVRNFGMLWPIGQPAGAMEQLARSSLDIWLDVLSATGLWHERCGSLHVAYHDDEAQVLREFVAADSRGCTLLSARETTAKCSSLRRGGLRAALWSPAETCVDPREVVAGLPAWLERIYGVTFAFGCPILGYDRPEVRTPYGCLQASQLIVCSGDEGYLLYPELFAKSGLVRCKLQMMRSEPIGGGWRLGPMLAAGLTLRHYKAFASCHSLPALVQRFDAELPDYGRYGIHVMAAQNGRGELVLGDSHEYGDAIDIFDKRRIDDLVVSYLQSFLPIPQLRIGSFWHGVYVKHPTEPYFAARPADGVTVVTGVGGAGMTLSFGLAGQIVATLE